MNSQRILLVCDFFSNNTIHSPRTIMQHSSNDRTNLGRILHPYLGSDNLAASDTFLEIVGAAAIRLVPKRIPHVSDDFSLDFHRDFIYSG